MAPFMRDVIGSINVPFSLMLYFDNRTQEAIGVGPITTTLGTFAFDPNAATSYQYNYYALNKTCKNFCPIANTGTRLVYYLYNDTTDTITGANLTQGSAGLQLWKRPWFIPSLGSKEVFITSPNLGLSSAVARPSILQGMAFPVYNSTGSQFALGQASFSVYDLASVLSQLRASATPNTLYYLLTVNAEVIVISGAAYDQGATLTQNSAGTWVLRTIWDFSYENNTLFNVSASNVWNYANRNLSTNFADATFTVGDYMFQVTTYTFVNYKWIIVSGAALIKPASDYLADTAALETQLKDRLAVTQRNIIIIGRVQIAVAIVVALSCASIAFTEFYISRPLHIILKAIQKAQTFDFSMVKSGSLKNLNRSPIAEIGNTQTHFMVM
ncbi:hypothetical protein HDU93_005784 [Gonapodya sp. JEL0774]|nr:hypothetical protein HDU93_005784 [Gonapodya sp. JEL0774]